MRKILFTGAAIIGALALTGASCDPLANTMEANSIQSLAKKHTTTTSAPATTTSTTVVATSTTAPATTAATTTTSAPSTSTTAPATTTSAPAPPSGVQFTEDFSDQAAFSQRFDRGWGGQDPATWPDYTDRILSWHGDHDGMCADPNVTSRQITIGVGDPGKEPTFYPCLPGGDPAKGHLMTAVNTVGYNAAWFSPRAVFNDVHKVCFDVNSTWEGGGRWVVVNFLTPAEYDGVNGQTDGRLDLGYTSPDFPNNGGPSTNQGAAQYGVKLFGTGMQSYSAGDFRGTLSGLDNDPSRAPRYKRCVEDLGNGNLSLTAASTFGTTSTEVPGSIPDGPIRVEFADDNYNPDKHCGTSPTQCPGADANGEVEHGTMPTYTWHWDNITIS